MYPLECFTPQNADNYEAIKYYIHLNKEYLKETSKEEYELFTEYLKGEGKDIIAKLKEAKTNKELYLCLNRIESALPYASKLKEHKKFEDKINALHKELASLNMRDVETVHKTSTLKQQRELAEEYDKIFTVINRYKDSVRQYNYLKGKIADKEAVKTVFSSKFGASGINEIGEVIKNAMEQLIANVKLTRKDAFNSLQNYYVKEQMYLIANQRASQTEK